MEGAAQQAALRAGFSGEQLAFFEIIDRYNETRIDELKYSNEGAMTALTQVLHANFSQGHASMTVEVDSKLGKPTILEKSVANCGEFAFKFKAHVAQQDAALADELEMLETPTAPPVPRSSLTPVVTSKKIYRVLCMLV